MGLPDLDVARRQHWCATRVPDHLRVECEVASRYLRVVERRPAWHEDTGEWSRLPVARLRYTTVRHAGTGG